MEREKLGKSTRKKLGEALALLSVMGVAAAVPASENTLWVATNVELLRLELADGRLLDRFPAATRMRAVAVDDGAARVWTFDDAGLLQVFDLDGNLLAATPFLDATPKVFLTAGAGFAWLGFQNLVYQVEATGAVVASLPLAKELKDLAFEPAASPAEGRVWLAHLQELRSFDLQGQPAASLPLGLQARVVAIDVDRSAGGLWIGLKSSVARYDASLAKVFEVAFPKVKHLVADGRGGCWVALHDEIVRLDATGATVTRTLLPALEGAPVTLVAVGSDSAGLGIWAATSQQLLRIGGSGLIEREIALSDLATWMRARDLATYVAPPSGLVLPPDPATVAPPLDPSVPYDVHEATRFLYEGDPLIQTEVVPGAIDPQKIVVLRGRVLDRAGAPLPGVNVKIARHPELGRTLSRLDGGYDLAANGGFVRLVFEKEGHLPLERQVEAPWRDFVPVEDVALTPFSPVATPIDTTAGEAQVARGERVSDGDGMRQSILVFPPEALARMHLPDGDVVELTRFTVRTTEITVGEDGPRAMPAPLPPASGYTYAFEATVDEAEAVGATRVSFDPPVAHYVENFLGFPVGGPVPTGWYDRELAAWVASDDGRVIRVLEDGEIDVDGSGEPASREMLEVLGITSDELEKIAELYAPGQELWRTPIPHFSAWDHNWPAWWGGAPPLDLLDFPDLTRPDCVSGSVIECQNQVLREGIAVVGTPFGLHYSSNRTPRRLAHNTLEIPLSRASVAPELKGIELEVRVAGKLTHQSFPALPNQQTRFEWDGRDAYGRVVEGIVPVRARLGYRYDSWYLQAGSFTRSFGSPPQTGQTTLRPARQDVTFWAERETTLRRFDAKNQGLGGWTLTAQHRYEPESGELLLGSGGRVKVGELSQTIGPYAGYGPAGQQGDGGPASAASLFNPMGMDLGPDGSVYVAVRDQVRRIDSRGILTTVAGFGGNGPPTHGVPATQSRLLTVIDVAVGPDGSLYFCQDRDLARVDPEGILHRLNVLGLLIPCRLVAAGRDGSVYTEARGTIYRLGAGQRRFEPLANVSGLGFVHKLDVGPDGSVYVVQDNRLRRVTPNGVLETVAGNGQNACAASGGPALQLPFRTLSGLDVTADGTIYLSDVSCHRIFEITPDGVARIVAGNGLSTTTGDGGAATAAGFRDPSDLLLTRSRDLLVLDQDDWLVRRVAQVGPISTAEGRILPSRDGQEVYVFDDRWRHLRTRDALTGALLYELSYQEGRLSAITDGDGNRTTIERDGHGTPTAIVAPFGQRTELGLDAEGYVSSVRNPAGEEVKLAYAEGGILTSMTDPREGVHSYGHTAEGSLESDAGPGSGAQQLTRVGEGDQWEVTLRSAIGRERRYAVERLTDGGERRSNVGTDGLVTESVAQTDGRRSTTLPDGTMIEMALGPDPRFGMAAPITTSIKLRTPGGLERTETFERSVTLANPADPLSLVREENLWTTAGKTTTQVYDATTRRLTTTSPEGRRWEAELDEEGRVVSGQLGDLEPVRLEYDAAGRVVALRQGVGEAERAFQLGFNSSGQLSTFTNSLMRSIHLEHDTADRVTRQVLPSGSEIGIDYDANGNPTAITPSGRPAHGFSYTLADLVASYTPPTVSGTGTISYGYDLDRQLVRLELSDGRFVQLGLDMAGRLEKVTHPGGMTSVAYDPATGQPSMLMTPESTLGFYYDGPLVTATTWTGQVNGNVSWSYDSELRIATERVNGSLPVAWQYDRDDLPIQVGDLVIGRNVETGLIGETTLASMTTHRRFNSFGELVEIEARIAGATIYQLLLERDKTGRITAKTEMVGNETHHFDYGYDFDGRLVSVGRDDLPWADYSYDANGNRLIYRGVLGEADGIYDDQDRLLEYGEKSYSYNATGEIQTKTQGEQIVHFDYDVFGSLRTVLLTDGIDIEYVVDGLGRRIGKKINGVLAQSFLYANEIKPIAELDGAGTVVARFVFGTNPIVPDYLVRNGATYRIVADQLGSPRLVINVATSEVVQRLDYDEFGRVLLDSNPGFQPFGFAGGLYDPQTKLLRFGARDYDPEIGRWAAKDPILFQNQNGNLYEYVGNDPINSLDPSGLLSLPIIGWVNVGEDYGKAALDFYADAIVDPDTPWYTKGGAWLGATFSAMWTPCTSDRTALTLFGGYVMRVIGPFSPRSLPPYVGRSRKYIRFDPPHHGKGWEWDGIIPKTIRSWFD